MPITLNVVNHGATAWSKPSVSSADELLKEACPKQHRRCQRLVQTSFTDDDPEFRGGHVSASQNGFVWAAYHAYSSHHHLIIRPEDVWFAILSQLSFFITARAEELRSFFVSHQGQKKLQVISEIADFACLARQMADLIAKNVIDPTLRDWVMPSFTTTTDCDKVVGSILFMGAMQKYFTYKMIITCGLPSVTLLGEVTDWQDILGRLDKIDMLGEEPAIFAKMLRPVLRHMILSFEDPTNERVLRFWNTIMHRNEVGSGADYLSGWLTAFCFWDEQGNSKRFYGDLFQLENVDYPVVPIDEVPAGFASVPVNVDDRGHKYKATMVAGSVGILATVSGHALAPEQANPTAQAPTRAAPYSEQLAGATTDNQEADPEPPVRTTVQPLSGWWMYEDERPEAAEARADEMRRLKKQLSDGFEAMHAMRTEEELKHLKFLLELECRLEKLRAY